MEKREMNIEIKETGKEMAGRLREFLAAEVERVNVLKDNENDLEKEAKNILLWIAARKKEKPMIIATLEQWGSSSVIVEKGKESKRYKSNKTLEEIKKVLEYINTDVCNDTTAVKTIDVQKNHTQNYSYSVIVRF